MIVLVLTAHPDDAEIGAGGTIADLVDAGHRVVVAVFTTSERQTHAYLRRAAAESAATLLGHELRWVAGVPPLQVEDTTEYHLVSLIDDLVTEVHPDVVITHWQGDSHADHRALALAAISSSRTWRATLLAMRPAEVRTTAVTSFSPTVFHDVTATFSRKLEAISQYAYEGQGFRPIDQESLRRVESYYGAVAGCDLAEAFVLVRQIGLRHHPPPMAPEPH